MSRVSFFHHTLQDELIARAVLRAGRAWRPPLAPRFEGAPRIDITMYETFHAQRHLSAQEAEM
jgi:hypothetical protein